jgi:hypothetical protein
MVPFRVILRHELLVRPALRVLAKENHAAQALRADGAPKPFSEGVQIR